MKRVKKSKLAMRLAKKGRRGDTILAHINPQEAMMLKAMGGSGGMNPKTGLPEFNEDDSDDGMGESSSDGYGGGVDSSSLGDSQASGGDYGRGFGQELDTLETVDPQGLGPGWDFGAQMGIDQQKEARSNYVDGRGMGFNSAYDAFADGPFTGIGYGLDKAGKSIARGFNDIANNPLQYGVNLGVGFTPLGMPNAISGLLGGPTFGSMAQRGYNSLAYGSPMFSSPSIAPSAPTAPGVPGAPATPGPSQPETMLASNNDPFLSQYGLSTPNMNPQASAPVAQAPQAPDWGRLTFDPERNNYFYSGMMGQG